MAEKLVGIMPRALIMKAQTWEDTEGGAEYLDVIVNEGSNMMLGKFQPNTNVEIYDANGSIGRYTLMGCRDGFYMFGRGNIA